MIKLIKELTFTVQDGLRVEGITVSMGATWIVENESWVLALSRANDGLYQARTSGGNRIKIVDFSS
jgi:PleD family two-component response regulator